MKFCPQFRRFIFYTACCIAVTNIQAQEILRALDGNPTLIQYRTTHPISRLKSISADTIKVLPFQDDFSSSTIDPDKKLWSDNYVYINSTLADSLPSIGIATFDALNDSGKLYSNGDTKSFSADVLTSNPINLGSLDSNLWLSFYYLPGGIGDPPSKADSLILEYKSPDSTKWNIQWVARKDVDTILLNYFSPETDKWDTIKITRNINKFKLTMVPVKKATYKKNGFRFRFRNTASFAGAVHGMMGNTDQWHIDYVYLNKGRSKKDTVYHDLAFFKPMSSLLINYTSIPYFQADSAKDSQIKDSINYSFRNNDSVPFSPSKRIRFTKYITENNLSSVYIDTCINIFEVNKFSIYKADPELINPFDANPKQQVKYEIKYYFDKLDNWQSNDTIKYVQQFSNYFAYDDGTSESGYGIANINGMVAYGFQNFLTVDTLTGIQIFFNPTVSEVNKTYYFKLGVWADNKGKPGVKLFKSPNGKTLKSFNKFDTYDLDSSIVIRDKRFYVGWYQMTDSFLNVGYDLNTTKGKNNLFYNKSGLWENSQISGSLMIRPIFRNGKTTEIPIIKRISFKIFPNPASDYITVDGESPTNPIKNIVFYNTLGKIVKRIENHESGTIEINEIPNGLYIIKVIFRNGTSNSLKLLKK